jgi:hypothetical protein
MGKTLSVWKKKLKGCLLALNNQNFYKGWLGHLWQTNTSNLWESLAKWSFSYEVFI